MTERYKKRHQKVKGRFPLRPLSPLPKSEVQVILVSPLPDAIVILCFIVSLDWPI